MCGLQNEMNIYCSLKFENESINSGGESIELGQILDHGI